MINTKNDTVVYKARSLSATFANQNFVHVLVVFEAVLSRCLLYFDYLQTDGQYETWSFAQKYLCDDTMLLSR